MFQGFYQDKKVWVTGHTGFKGAWLSLWLHQLGAEVHGLSDQDSLPFSLGQALPGSIWKSDLRGDVRDLKTLKQAIRKIQPSLIFHLAAQPLVRLSYDQPLETLQTNVLGTANLLEAVRLTRSPAHVVVITTDKCYENREWLHGYRETDALGGHDVYSASKAGAELVTHSWRRSFFMPDEKLGNLASARAGNVIGGGDYAPDRLLPDCVRALRKGQNIEIRNPNATRPWQHVLDCLSGYLTLGSHLASSGKNNRFSSAFNFGPSNASNRTVKELVEAALLWWPGEWFTDAPDRALHEAKLLHLSTDLAAQSLRWFPVWDFEQAVEKSMSWYRARHDRRKTDPVEHSIRQIQEFQIDAVARQVAWAQTT